MICPLLPTGDAIVLHDTAPRPRSALLVTPDRPSYRGTVHAIGPEVADVTIGDHVQYRPFVGTRIDVEGQSWMLVREEECLCRLV